MSTFWLKAFELIVSLGLLVFIHELGHYTFSRLFKVKVDRFYLFFNPWFSIVSWNPKKHKVTFFKNPEDPKHPWVHQLMNFLADEQHLKNLTKTEHTDIFAWMLSANWIDKVELNLFYKESNTLLKYMVRDGLKVKCYYKEDKK